MNREIKFRAWDSIAGQMWEDVYFDGGHIYTIGPDGENASTMPRWDDNALMQFTGLLDKNGKEIFEGDIIIWQDTGSNYPNIMHKKEVVQWGNIGWDGFSPIYENEVIGNIYENKEILG